MHYRRTILQRLSFVALVVLFIQLSLSISPVLSQDIKIGTQVWTSKNLNVSTFRNGESIPEAKSKEEWAKAGENQTAAFCYYEYDRENGEVLGKLYNWYAVNDSRGLAPNGYHIPSDAEWTILTDFLGGKPIAGEKMKSITGWYKSDKDEWNNKRGFNALLGGENIDGDFYNITDYGYWWSSSELLTYYAWSRNLYDNNTKVGRDSNFKDKGFSVRCLRD